MAWGDMLFSGGMELVKAGLSYSAAKDKAKSDKMWQRYNNTMTNISAALSNNDVTTNEMLARTRSIQQGSAIRKSEFLTTGTAEATAGAAGVTGRSVNAVLFDIGRNAATADQKRVDDWNNQEIGFTNQRQKIAQQALTQQDTRTIPEPSLATTMLGLVAPATKLYKDNTDTIKQGVGDISNWYNNL